MLSFIVPIVSVLVLTLLVVMASRLIRDRRVRRLLSDIEPRIEPALRDACALYNYSHYVTESERLSFDAAHADLEQALREVHRTRQFRCSPFYASAERLYCALSDTHEHKKENNSQFIRRELAQQKSFFDTVMKFPLDAQQRESIVSLEDNVLVISSAGSGKTMTTVGKVRYLIDKQGVDPSKILLITFTRKAAESLSERLGEKSLRCVTFHKLALDLIGEATDRKPTIADPGLPATVYHDLMDNNADFRTAVYDYILESRYKTPDQFECLSREEYIAARRKYGVDAYYKDMDGRKVFCKSDEESRLCDYLGSHGIPFRYEERYEYDTVDKDFRQYCPDFSIYYTDEQGHARRIYLEHFAVNEQGRCPGWFTPEEQERYLEGIQWKRNLHKERGTVLLVTRSADFHDGTVFRKLEAQLRSQGVNVDGDPSEDVSRELDRQEHSIIDMLSAFNFLLRSKGETVEQLRGEARLRDRATIDHVIVPFVTRYREICQEKGVIDFTDAIIEATALCREGHRPDYDYILVDEFQDISLDRYRFLQSLRRAEPITKLFCVGDDWQSIYRFAGSDISLFKRFDRYFGYTKECRMETTYRFGDPCVSLSSRFILTNGEQKAKTVVPFDSRVRTDLRFMPAPYGMGQVVKEIVAGLPYDASIYLLGRYGSDVHCLDGAFSVRTDYDGHVSVRAGGRTMTFMTVHQSKGLESDYVILLNCNGGTMGFPSEIADSPILNYVLSEPDSFEFSEERRVFYVALTRAKRCTYVLYDPKKPSAFISEFVAGVGRKTERANEIPEDQRCPLCHCGRRIKIKTGTAVNGNPYYVFACSNEAYGCDYRETKFVNLNNRYQKNTTRYRNRKS